MKVFIAVLLIVCMHFSLRAQITGTLRDTAGKALPHITVVLAKPGNRIIAFSVSNASGQYVINFPDAVKTDSLFLEINSLQFQSSRQPVKSGHTQYDFRLTQKVFSLPEVKARAKPVINSNGDTLSYNVASFARPEDRSIADVLKRLPGIEVGDNGQISYNGKAIFNLYIHGDDLMDGRYGLATKVISKDMISSVDVIQNHQPVKVLKNRERTDKVSINLVLKDENSVKLAGQAMLGAGLPAQADAAVNLILLNKRFKMINSGKINNSGIDYRNDFQQFGATDMLNEAGNTRPSALLQAGNAGDPDLPRSNYYLNRSAAGNFNNLINTSSGLQLRSNIQLFFDRNTFNYTSTVKNYIEKDTITFNEYQSAIRTPWLLNASFSATANKDKYYLENKLQVNTSGETNKSSMQLNNMQFGQRLHNRITDLANDFSWVPALKNNGLMSVRWRLNYYRNAQQLGIDKGLHALQLNNDSAFAAIRQTAATPSFFSHASFSYQLSGKFILQEYQAGILNERQQLNSLLQLTELPGNTVPYKGDAGNALKWNRNRLYGNAVYYVKRERWDARLALPVSWQWISYAQPDYQLDHKDKQLWVNPSARLKLALNVEDNLTLTYSYNNSVGNISGVYRGVVLTNYRSLMASNASLQEKYTSSTSLSYNFQRSIIMLFINAGISYEKIGANSILSSVLTNNIQQTVLLPYSNDQSRFSVLTGISKYLFGLKTTASLKATFRRERYEQFINNTRLPVFSTNRTISAGLESKLFNAVNLNYNGTATWYTSKSAALRNAVTNLDQQIILGYTPLSNLVFQVKGRHIHTSQSEQPALNYFFSDAGFRYKLVKWRLDMECDVTNIQHIKTYEIIRLSSNQLMLGRYDIRGRMAMLRITFNI